MIRWGNRILFALNFFALVIIILYFGRHHLIQDDRSIEYKDLITIILTAIAVLLAAVTLFVAAMAIWGYNSIKDESVKAATKAAETEAHKVATDVASSVASRAWLAMNSVTGEGSPTANDDDLVSALQSGSDAPSKPNRSRRKIREPITADKADGNGQ